MKLLVSWLQDKKAMILGAATLVIAIAISISCLFVSWQTKRVTVTAIKEMAELLATSTVDLKRIKGLQVLNTSTPISISIFRNDLTHLLGRQVPLTKRMIRDMKLALTTGYRVENLSSGYEIIPQGKMLIMISAAPHLLPCASENNLLAWLIFALVLMGVTFPFVYGLLQPNKEVQKYRAFVARIAGVEDQDLPTDKLFQKVQGEIEGLRAKLKEAGVQKLKLKREIEQLKRSLRRTTQDLEATQEHLLRAGTLSALGEFAAGISHELNNPMGIVLGFTQHLLDEVSPDHPHYAKLKRMETELGRCQRILQDLLAFARPLEPVVRPIDINQLVKETVQFVFYPRIEGIEVVCNLENGLPPVEADPDQLEQVLINLLKNAVQAIEDTGQITVTTCSINLTREDVTMLTAPVVQPGALLMEDPGTPLSLRVPKFKGDLQVDDPAVRIDIKDTGVGIDPQNFKKIFTPFYTTKKDGTGLGLSICWKLIRRNRGILKVSSDPGIGTTFSIILPIKKENEDHGT